MVIGVGGAGGNAVNNMIRSNLTGVEFLVANTDSQALAHSSADRRIQLGINITRGLGAGAQPEIGRAAAEETMNELIDHLEDCNMVFITAGMGGGTGSGAAPVIAQAARQMGILTVGVITKPFHFEGAHRMRVAEQAIKGIEQYVDTLIIIPNQNLFRVANERTTFADAFKMADDVLYSGVRGITDLMTMPGLINLDFADIRNIMSEMGKAMMGTGEADGEDRAIEAAEAAIANPLLEDASMQGARGVLINITGGLDMTLFEVDAAANRIRDEVDPNANIIFGSTFDETLEGKIRISVVATGIDAENAAQKAPLSKATATATQPKTMLNAAQPTPTPAPAARSNFIGTTRPAPATRPATGANKPFIPGPTIDPEQHATADMPEYETPAATQPTPAEEDRAINFFGRASTPARDPAPQPASQPLFGETSTLPPATRNDDDDMLEIPAFLRRQVN